MGLPKQAKALDRSQVKMIREATRRTRNPIRNELIFVLSVQAGLRAKEIAGLRWDMLTDPEGRLAEVLRLRDSATKGSSGRQIPISRELRRLLSLHALSPRRSDYLISSERSECFSPAAIVNLFAGWFKACGLRGCSSHSGRRTFITNAARKISTVGGSLRDVQALAGHKSISTTQTYIEQHESAQRKIVDLI